MPPYDSLLNHGEYFSPHYFAEQLDDDLRSGLFKTWTSREGDQYAGEQRETPRVKLPRLHGEYFAEKARTFFAERANLEAADPQGLAQDQFGAAFTYDDPDWRGRVVAWHRKVLAALGYPVSSYPRIPQASSAGDPREPSDGVQTETVSDGMTTLTVHHAGRDYTVHVAYKGPGVVALDCGWAGSFDGLLATDGPARLLEPLRITSAEQYRDGAALASLLLHAEEVDGGQPPRFVLLLLGGVIALADRHGFGEGRYLAANLDAALPRGRQDLSKTGELPTIAALFSRDMLEPGESGDAPLLDRLLEGSTRNAVGVADELRDGLRDAVETIANEVLRRLKDADVSPRRLAASLGIDDQREFARRLTRESLRYLYRILFLLYAESRPELGILPAEDEAYEAGYSVARLRELVSRDEQLAGERSRNGFHLHESLDLLFRKVNEGHRPFGTEAGDRQGDARSEGLGLRFEPLRSELFAPGAVTLIGTGLRHPDFDDDDLEPGAPLPREQRLDTRLRNETLHSVLRRLTLTTGRKGPRGKRERGGFISYRNLGINQLGAVYEGLMSYTGFIADEELFEVARKGEADGGSWMIPASKVAEYPDDVFVTYPADDPQRRSGRKRHARGEFVYRLSGRERQTSASYYTPESLTQLTVELALRELVKPHTTAAEILQYKICEPALGSGAFLNEAINQVAVLYLARRQEELGTAIPTSQYLAELQKVKAYVALHNSYGVDLNETAVELAEVSLWLNTMHPGMHAPWFGLHLRHGNSLIGGRRAVYAAEDVVEGHWAKARKALPPRELPFRTAASAHDEAGAGVFLALPEGAVHQFLLPAAEWGAIAAESDARALEPLPAKQLTAWRRRAVRPPSTKAPRGKKSQLVRLQALARRTEFLWALVDQRIALSEKQIARKIDVWGVPKDTGDPDHAVYAGFFTQPENPVPKETVYQHLFEAKGTPYWRLKLLMDTWCALWFWPLDKASLLDGTDPEYDAQDAGDVAVSPEQLACLLPTADVTVVREVSFIEQPVLFGYEQGTLISAEDSDELPVTELKVGGPAKKTALAKPVRRRRIPLAELEDWIDFAECVLGARDVPEDSLIAEFKSLTKLHDYEESLPSLMGMDSEFRLNERFPWLSAAQEIAAKQGFFHWELAFAHSFTANGGFDLQVGNPPWVRPEWKEDLVLAEFDPWFTLDEQASEADTQQRRMELVEAPEPRRYWLEERVTTTGLSGFLSSPVTYEILAGQPDSYRGFMVRIWSNMRLLGVAGLIHPDTHFSGNREGELRAAAYHRLRVHGDFVNAANRFFPPPVGRASHFGVHIYAHPRNIEFDHLSWLLSADALRLSATHDGSGEIPGITNSRGEFDERPHKSRVVRVDANVLSVWRRLMADDGLPIEEARLLFPVSVAEATAIAALAAYPRRLGMLSPQITSGYHESDAKRVRLIAQNQKNDKSESTDEYQPTRWRRVVLKGPQISVATPIFKRHSAKPGEQGRNLVSLSSNYVADTGYVRGPAGSQAFLDEQRRWIDYVALGQLRSDEKALKRARAAVALADGVAEEDADLKKVDAVLVARARRRYATFFRVAWRKMISTNSERALYAAIVPRGATHIHGVNSLAMRDMRHTALVAGFWASLPVDYFVRITGQANLEENNARAMPAPEPEHPLASSLLLRTLRLNCLTEAYAELWSELYDPIWTESGAWAIDWPKLQPLHDVTPNWLPSTPLRSERARRAALVEIDALVAVWIGMDADALIAAYRGRFPVLQKFEAATWFDAEGWKLASHAFTTGWRQTKESWKQFEEYLADPSGGESIPAPQGYTAPFYKADREAEMRAAHAVFKAQLDAAIASGEFDPEAAASQAIADEEESL